MDCMEILYEMKDLLCEELERINKKHDFSNMAELEVAYKAVDIIKDISTIEAMEESSFGDFDDFRSFEDGKYSGRRGRMGRRSYGRNYDNRMMDRGYSGDESKEQMMHQISELQRKIQQM